MDKEGQAQRIIQNASDANVNSSLYTVLGLRTDASDPEIKLAYRKLALKFHPDKNKSTVTPSAEMAFKAINLAFSCLSDPQMRERYDMLGGTDPEQIPAPAHQDIIKLISESRKKSPKLKDELLAYVRALEAEAAKSTSKDSMEDGDDSVDDEDEHDTSPVLNVLPKSDSGGWIMAALTAAIFTVYFASPSTASMFV